MAIELNDRQSAAPNQCGSCQYFRAREPGDGHGLCLFKLPPWVITKADTPFDKNVGWEVDPRTVRDTDDCSLYEAKNLAGDPAQFVQKRYWNAGNPQR